MNMRSSTETWGHRDRERSLAEPSLPDEPTKVPCISCLGPSRPLQSPAKYYQVTSGKPRFLIHRIVKSNNNAFLFRSLFWGRFYVARRVNR